MSQKSHLKIRPHHLFCIYNFVGKGYTDKFVINFKNILNRLNNNEHFKVIENLDSICTPCPEHNGKTCNHQSKVAKLDQQYLKLLDIKIGAILNWQQVQRLIKYKVDVKNFSSLCSNCEWFAICQKKIAADNTKERAAQGHLIKI